MKNVLENSMAFNRNDSKWYIIAKRLLSNINNLEDGEKLSLKYNAWKPIAEFSNQLAICTECYNLIEKYDQQQPFKCKHCPNYNNSQFFLCDNHPEQYKLCPRHCKFWNGEKECWTNPNRVKPNPNNYIVHNIINHRVDDGQIQYLALIGNENDPQQKWYVL